MNKERTATLKKAKSRKYAETVFLDAKGKESTKEIYLKQLEKRLQAEDNKENKPEVNSNGS